MAKPVIRGLRYPVESILEYLAGGDSPEDIVNEFDDLKLPDIYACLAYAAAALRAKSIQIKPFNSFSFFFTRNI
jgi:uncharacterized protein (DUF433 family)